MTDEQGQLIQELDDARVIMHALIVDLMPESEIYPGWTLRQFLAHLTGWDDVTTTTLQAHARNETPATPVSAGIDSYNAESVATRETLDLAHIVKEWELAREELKAAIRALSPEQLTAPLLHPWGRVSTVARLVHIMIHHEGEEHADELRAMQAKRAAAP
ncbi:MAG TPA: maleylpyruvate isomerase N-terminal domain-containing protein [Anaerolineae bacterium]|nr:maleylpyruvate isomerase N-terminal domain-containing protein [Anaerolineae bacterium]